MGCMAHELYLSIDTFLKKEARISKETDEHHFRSVHFSHSVISDSL